MESIRTKSARVRTPSCCGMPSPLCWDAPYSWLAIEVRTPWVWILPDVMAIIIQENFIGMTYEKLSPELLL